MKHVLCINSGGIGDLHGLRARRLARSLEADVTFHDVDKSRSRRHNARTVWQLLTTRRWDLVYQEATGIAGGLPLIRAAATRGQPYVISTGDPVAGYFRNQRGRLMGYGFGAYERLLYRHCAGFIGWTPYLTGRALHLGARRAVTIEGAVDLDAFSPASRAARAQAKADFGLPADHLVCGVVGSLKWSARQQYCYGLELVAMLPFLQRRDVSLLIVGDGDGRAVLERQIPDAWRSRVVLTGRIPHARVAQALHAMDIGFITQTLDTLGSYRLTTKLPEYLAAGLPVAMSPIPGFYDYVHPAGWALPPLHPATPAFHRQCAQWLDALAPGDVRRAARHARPVAERHFGYDATAARFAAFVHPLLGVTSKTLPAAPEPAFV